jgi:hypothetical protein
LLRRLHDPGQTAPVGLPAGMEASKRSDQFIPAGLASLGIAADEIDFAVMNAAHAMFWPGILDLLSRDLSAVVPEAQLDLSRAPEDR